MHHNAPAVMRDQDHGVVSKPNHIDKKPGHLPGRLGYGTYSPEYSRPRAPRPAQASRAEVLRGQARQELPNPAVASQKPRPPPRAPTLVIPPPFIAVPRQGAWPSSSSYVISAGFNSRTIKYSPRERVVPRHTFCSSC